MEKEMYKWAENSSKLKRAIDEVKDKGIKFKDDKEKEDAVMIVYRRLLGRIVGEPARGSKEDTSHYDEGKIEEAYHEGYADCKGKKKNRYKKEVKKEEDK